MVDAARAAHAVVVLLAVGAYSVVFFRGVNNHASRYMYSVLEEEVNKNPHMKKDLDEYKAQVEEQERQKEQMKELEEQAKRIQQQLQEMTKSQKHSFRSPKYVKVEETDAALETKANLLNELGNQSKEYQQARIEL